MASIKIEIVWMISGVMQCENCSI